MTEYNHACDKSTWGEGPWQHEPDGGAWTTASGLLGCFIRHPRHGQLNGYVAVAPGHPLYGKHYDEPDVSVHGGLTFSGSLTDGRDPYFSDVLIDVDERLWWFGFDCHHYMDLAPGMIELTSRLGMDHGDFGETYKPLAYVKAEVESLAQQLAVAEVPA